MLDLTLPIAPPKVLVPAQEPKERFFAKTEPYQPLEKPHAVEQIEWLYGDEDDHVPGPRFFEGSMAPPNSKHEVVTEYKVQGLQRGLKIKVIYGELFSQADVTVLLHLIKMMTGSNCMREAFSKCIDAKALLARRGNLRPSFEDYAYQKLSLTRFARTKIELSYSNGDTAENFTGTILSIGDYIEKGKSSGQVYYDDLTAKKLKMSKCRLGRLDKFSVMIHPVVVKFLSNRKLRTMINLNDRRDSPLIGKKRPPLAQWISYKLAPLRDTLIDSGFNSSIMSLMHGCGMSGKKPEIFESELDSALRYLVVDGLLGSYHLYTDDSGFRRVLISSTALAKYYVERLRRSLPDSLMAEIERIKGAGVDDYTKQLNIRVQKYHRWMYRIQQNYSGKSIAEKNEATSTALNNLTYHINVLKQTMMSDKRISPMVWETTNLYDSVF